MLNETLIHSTKSFFQINFDSHKMSFTLGGCHGMNDFLSEDNIVAHFPTGDEARLQGVDQVIKVRLQPLNEYFCDSFVQGVKKF